MYDRKPLLAEKPWKMAVLSRVGKTRFRCEELDLTIPFPKEHHGIEYRHSRIADIILQIVWETNTSHAECGQLSIEW